MKLYAISFALLLCFQNLTAQTKGKIIAPQVPCNGTADAVEGIYTDHTNPKYGSLNLKGTAAEKAAMMKNLVVIEKLEEASRRDFKLTGCAARVSFATWGNSDYGKNAYARYGYQLGVYQYVCHVTEHIPKIVDEYRTVFRVDMNPSIFTGTKAGGTGEFTINGQIRYEIPVEARSGANFEHDKKNSPSRVSQYISESDMLANRSTDYKNKHADFLKIINGDGYVENWMRGSQYDKRGPDSYTWVDRHYLITKPGVPLLVPVSRKQYLEDMLEYLEIEKANFLYSHAKMVKDYANETADWAKKKMVLLEQDRDAYPKIYEAKKAKLKGLLATQKPEWLQQPAVVDNNNRTYEAYKRLESLGKFYDAEDEYISALYVLNPRYFNAGNSQSTQPIFMEIQFRYETGKDSGFSTRLFNNFLKNFDREALRKML
ncbi:hypothetical protein ACTJIJ_20255 [Niabella sp. 22666]|uniref:hypothetical protein n=1 Tax=Niabella sp. 22666 TaxID=3453954 RepID=UPI003F8558E8